jgi:hypothetical protein
MKTSSLPFLLITLFLIDGSAYAQAGFFSINSSDCDIRLINTSGTTLAIRRAQLPGVNFNCAGFGGGLARDPASGDYFAIVRLRNTISTRLIRINDQTGEISSVGDTDDFFESLAMNTNGTLYGVTTDTASNPEMLFVLNKTNASKQALCPLANGHTIKAIAFNQDDGKIYHSSGIDLNLFEKLDPATCQIQSIGFITNMLIAPMALLYTGSNNFVLADFNSIHNVSTTGVVTNTRTMDHTSRGLALRPAAINTVDLNVSGSCRRKKKTSLTEKVTIQNQSAAIAKDAMLGTRLPNGIQFLSSSGSCTVMDDLLLCELGDLSPGSSLVLDIQYRVSLPQNAVIRHDLNASSNEFELIRDFQDNTLAINGTCK